MAKKKILGLVLDEGGETSHTVILARTLEIPTILDTENATRLIANDDLLIVDGLNGEVTVNPGKSFITRTLVKKEKYLALEKHDWRYDVGVKYGLLTAQVALALNGQDRDEVLTTFLELLASREMVQGKG